MKTILYASCFLTCVVGARLCGAANPGDYSVTVSPRAVTVLVGEPVFVTAVFTNHTTEGVSLLGAAEAPGYGGRGAQGSIQVATNGGAFSEVSAFESGERVIIPPKVPARDSVTERFTLFSDKSGRLLFQEPGEYRARVGFNVVKASESYWVFSDPASITVRPPSDDDLMVWNLLSAEPLYGSLVLSPGSTKLSEADYKHFENILQNHSRSSYAPYLALLLGRQAFEVQDGSRPLDLPRAKAYLDRALTLASGETVRTLAADGLEGVSRVEQWELQRQKDAPKPVMTNLFYRATTELESQWYDVSGFMRGRYPGARDSLDKILLLGVEYRHSSMSGEEFDRRRAELLREAVRKHLKPLDSDEWRRCKGEYAKEDEARAKAEAERMRKLKEETDPPSGPVREP